MGLFNFLNRTNKPDQVSLLRRNFGFSGGTNVNPETAMEASAFYRGVIYISSQIAKLPWEVKDAKNIILDNDISYMLNVSPNPEMTAMHFKMFLIQCALIDGNGYAEIERTIDGRPVAMWPLSPRRVHPIRDFSGTLWYQVSNGQDQTAETVYLKPRDLFIVRNLHTKDGIQGQGLIAYAMQTLGISIGADKFANSLFANGGMPSGILSHPGKLSDTAYQRLKESWKEQHGGKKTGGTALLEEGIVYTPISHSPDVLQFLESRQFNVLEIARFLGIPPTKLFDTHSAKFNNIEHANLEVATDTLDSWARNLESEADMKLLAGQKAGRYTELDLYAVFRGDMATRSTYFKNMMSVGAMTPNEIREKEGMAAYDGGSRYYIATNNFTPSDRLDEVIDSQIKTAATPPAPKSDTSKPQSSLDEALVEFVKSKTPKN
jgi:HK97 family phage portal protein